MPQTDIRLNPSGLARAQEIFLNRIPDFGEFTDFGSSYHKEERAYKEERVYKDEARALSVALALQRTGGLAGVALFPPGESTLAEEVHRLRRAILGTERRPGLAAVLHELAMDPHRVLRPTEAWAPTDQARRPAPARLAHALVHGRNLRPDGTVARVLDARVEHETDVYENRLVNAFVLLLERRIRWLAPAVRKRGSKPVEREVETLARILRDARRRASFLDGVGELGGIPDRVSMVLLNRPAYRAVLDGYLELHRRIAARFEDPALDAPLENLPYLYQVWGTLQVIRALLDAGADLGYAQHRQELVMRTRDGVVVRVLQNGEPALVLRHPATGVEAAVIPQPTYGRRGTRDVRSFTYDQKPDVAVVVRRPGERPRLWLFDPKYKLDGEPLEEEPAAGKPMKVDIDKMHAYRDAIRHESGERVVEYAAIMYPGPAVEYPVGIDALSAIPGDTRAMERRLEIVLRGALGGPP